MWIGAMKMDWIDLEYPFTAYVVEVKYSGDIAIGTARVKELPKDRDYSYGFTVWFWDYEKARKHARHVAKELGIPADV